MGHPITLTQSQLKVAIILNKDNVYLYSFTSMHKVHKVFQFPAFTSSKVNMK